MGDAPPTCAAGQFSLVLVTPAPTANVQSLFYGDSPNWARDNILGRACKGQRRSMGHGSPHAPVRAWCTLIRLTPRALAITVGPCPASCISRTFSIGTDGLRPLQTPLAAR